MMPIAITLGAIFYNFFTLLAFITPYLIFVMLFLTYSKLRLNHMRLTRLHLWLILIQIFGSLAVFLVLSPFNITLAQGAMICVLAPTATAAPVIVGMLKGNVESLTSYSLLSNMTVALAAPIIFSLVGPFQNLPFIDSVMAISQRVVILLFSPFLLAMLMQKFTPNTIQKVSAYAGLSFYVWCFALSVVSGRTVVFIMQQNSNSYIVEILVAVGALVVCISQFVIGRLIGKKYDDTVAGGQGLGQKNTILAIWMAQMYLNPIACIGPGAYVLWQNLINSYEIWRERRSL